MSSLAELPSNTTSVESEEKSEPANDGNHWSPENHHDPFHQLPANPAKLGQKPQHKLCNNILSSQHIDPRMGHLKRVHIADNSKQSTKVKDQTKVILQHPQACNHCLQDLANTNLGLRSFGMQKVRWSLADTARELQHIQLQCCCAPSAAQQLPSSTSVFCKARKELHCPESQITDSAT